MKLIKKGQSSAERINTKSTVLNQTYHQKIQDGSFGNLNRPICKYVLSKREEYDCSICQ
jgi:hypothetical protein